MLLSGDECRRTQKGNNNAYCQDNAISWFDWDLVDRHADLWRFCQNLIHFRRRQPTVRRQEFLTGRVSQPGGLPDVSWYAADGGPVDWTGPSALICLLTRPAVDEQSTVNACDLLFLLNSTSEPKLCPRSRPRSRVTVILVASAPVATAVNAENKERMIRPIGGGGIGLPALL